ncbi:hypothetical protein F66182_14923 [Fusarium sp. NRRL 66182]|nr:hypothetical protein F66182_14923 [Fusarium sp. NRRL 66182]
MAVTTEPKLISPSSFGHFGLRTTPENFEAMVKWHLDFFGGTITLRNDNAAFIAYDDEHHRLVIVNDKNFKPIASRKHAQLAMNKKRLEVSCLIGLLTMA